MKIGVGIMVTAITLTACSSAKTGIKAEANSTSSSTIVTSPPFTESPTTEAPTTAPRADAVIGSTITLAGQDNGEQVDVTLVKFVNPAAPTDQFSTPEAGKHFAAAQFRIHNTGTTVYDDSAGNDVTLVDTLGQTFSADYNDTTAGPSFADGQIKIGPGDTVLGFVTVQVPDTSTPAKIRWGLDSGFAETGEWKVL